VFNRLVGEKGKVDSMLRIVKIEQDGGAKAAVITFAAHCTVFSCAPDGAFRRLGGADDDAIKQFW